MATVYPFGDFQPLGPQTQPELTDHDLVILHTMVNSLSGTATDFKAAGFTGKESHFGIGHDGTVIQWQDLDFRADANLEANRRAISIETADRGTGFPDWDPNGSNVPAWTNAQLDAIVKLVIWLCDKFDIPKSLIPDTKPSRRGIGYHRQGMEPMLVDGGEAWSEGPKACPGDRRVKQIETIVIPRVQRGEEDDMTVEELLNHEIGTGEGRFKIATLLANAALLPVIKRKGDELAARIAEIESKLPG